MKLLLKNGILIDYKTSIFEPYDILIEEGKVQKIAKEIQEEADKIIDCTNLYIMPGMIDIHCHLREPGFEYKETIETGSKSAVSGGFTTICPMPNTKPTPDSAIILQKIIEEGKRVGLCNVLPYSSVSKGEKGEELVDFEEMKTTDLVVAIPEDSKGTAVELGWASCMKIKILLLLDSNQRYTPLISGLKDITDVETIWYDGNLNRDVLTNIDNMIKKE